MRGYAQERGGGRRGGGGKNKIKGEKNDAFAEQGSGFGRTFIFDIIPLRIDFILSDPEFKVRAFENFDVTYSDHFPIMAVLEL